MKLNMTIIFDHLDRAEVTKKRISRPFDFYLDKIEICTGKMWQVSSLCIADAKSLPGVPETKDSVSLICIGQLPDAYTEIPCE